MLLPTFSVAEFMFDEEAADWLRGGVEVEYEVGEGLGEPLALCWFVLTFGASF